MANLDLSYDPVKDTFRIDVGDGTGYTMDFERFCKFVADGAEPLRVLTKGHHEEVLTAWRGVLANAVRSRQPPPTGEP